MINKVTFTTLNIQFQLLLRSLQSFSTYNSIVQLPQHCTGKTGCQPIHHYVGMPRKHTQAQEAESGILRAISNLSSGSFQGSHKTASAAFKPATSWDVLPSPQAQAAESWILRAIGNLPSRPSQGSRKTASAAFGPATSLNVLPSPSISLSSQSPSIEHRKQYQGSENVLLSTSSISPTKRTPAKPTERPYILQHLRAVDRQKLDPGVRRHTVLNSPQAIRDQPVIKPALKEALREHLERSYYLQSKDTFQRELKGYWQTGFVAFKLKSFDPINSFYPKQLLAVCNKSALLYHVPQPSLLPLAAISKQWFRHYKGRPNIQSANFFASPVQVLPQGPTTIPDIVEAHRSIWKTASIILSTNGDTAGYLKDERTKISLEHCIVQPTLRSILLIMDKPVRPEGEYDQNVVLDDILRQATMVMVRTGHECGVSFSFETIRDHWLPLDRNDVGVQHGIDAVRVNLSTAVEFVCDLHDRVALLPEAPDDRSINRSSPPHTVDLGAKYVDKLMREAEAIGFHNVQTVRSALEQLAAVGRGEYDLEDEGLDSFRRCWQ